MAMPQPSDETIRLVWEGAVDADRLCRYYGYLAGRLKLLGDAAQIAAAGFSLVALAALAALPDRVALAALALSLAAAACGPVGRFHQKASLSGDLYGRLARISLEWQDLWAGAFERDGAELRGAWRDLSQRSLAIVERAPLDLPLWEDLAERSQREADECWAGRRAA